MIDCSEKLRALREGKHLTQSQLAARVGVSKATISAYETASKAPSLDVLIRLSRVFGVTVDYLVCMDAPRYIDISGLDEEAAAIITELVNRLSAAGNDLHDDSC